jgi:hypothetical protein
MVVCIHTYTCTHTHTHTHMHTPQIHLRCCICCSESFGSSEQLLSHMTLQGHFTLPTDTSKWNQPQWVAILYRHTHCACNRILLRSFSNNDVADEMTPHKSSHFNQKSPHASYIRNIIHTCSCYYVTKKTLIQHHCSVLIIRTCSGK